MSDRNVEFFNEHNTTEGFQLAGIQGPMPFPFNLSYELRLMISSGMALNFVAGSYLRIKIGWFLLEPSSKMGPINLLIWIDQFNGIFLAINILGRIISFALPFPLSHVTGDTFCVWSPLPGQTVAIIKDPWLLHLAYDLR